MRKRLPCLLSHKRLGLLSHKRLGYYSSLIAIPCKKRVWHAGETLLFSIFDKVCGSVQPNVLKTYFSQLVAFWATNDPVFCGTVLNGGLLHLDNGLLHLSRIVVRTGF